MNNPVEQNQQLVPYGIQYTEEKFWSKLKHFARRAGREVVEKALTLYYVLQDADTPVWIKTAIAGALGYFILPVDIIPDVAPALGYSDDLTMLAAAITTAAAYVKPEHLQRAREKTGIWFAHKTRTR
jgi:uncharacterized membrane protein YkvA (DUF1232 family)